MKNIGQTNYLFIVSLKAPETSRSQVNLVLNLTAQDCFRIEPNTHLRLAEVKKISHLCSAEAKKKNFKKHINKNMEFYL